MPLIIAHRGASAYLPEHTLEAKALAYGLGADCLEQDVVATRDNELVVLHDIHLDRVSDVAQRFPDRQREDGRYYARDFDLRELRQLNVHERRAEDGRTAVYGHRFPTRSGHFRIASLREEIEMIQGLNRSMGRHVAIYPEVKRPAWHRDEGVDVFVLLLKLLAEYGYRKRNDAAWLQCFDAAELKRARKDLGSELRQVQLLGENAWGEADTDYERLKTPGGLRQVATYADGIGPSLRQLYVLADIDGHPVSTGLVSAAHAAGLVVHPYTFRADDLAPGFGSFAAMVHWFVSELAIDGLFTDFPDRARAALAG
jgi:glycerophosphoryl diester phosphodiesterase